MATYNEFIRYLETPDDDESVHDAPLEDGHPSFATVSEESAHSAMVNCLQVAARNEENMVQQMGVLNWVITNMARSTVDLMNDSSS